MSRDVAMAARGDTLVVAAHLSGDRSPTLTHLEIDTKSLLLALPRVPLHCSASFYISTKSDPWGLTFWFGKQDISTPPSWVSFLTPRSPVRPVPCCLPRR